jgi:hypothetical protein
VSVTISAGIPTRSKDQWSDQSMPGMSPGAVPPSLGNGASARKAATARRTKAREETRPTKATKSPLVG